MDSVRAEEQIGARRDMISSNHIIFYRFSGKSPDRWIQTNRFLEDLFGVGELL